MADLPRNVVPLKDSETRRLLKRLTEAGHPPHEFNGETWKCLACGEISVDPCDCGCH